jgi:hypothetical protein
MDMRTDEEINEWDDLIQDYAKYSNAKLESIIPPHKGTGWEENQRRVSAHMNASQAVAVVLTTIEQHSPELYKEVFDLLKTVRDNGGIDA